MSDVRRGWGDVLLVGLTAVGGLRPFHRVARKAIVSLRASELVPRHTTGSINGRKVRLDLNEMVDQKIALFGAFDARGLGLIKRVMQAINCRTAIDVGANIGNHTAFFSDWARRVIAIEPNPPVFQRLAQFIDENHLSNVTSLQVALSDKAGELVLFTSRDRSHLATLEHDDEISDPVNVPVERGDDLLARLMATDVDFIKIDVEGHERECLAGLERTLASHRPVLTVELVAKTLAKYGSPEALAAALPGYSLYGTRTSFASRIFKTALSLEPFEFGKLYSHVLCVPEERRAALASLTGDFLPSAARAAAKSRS